MDREAAIKTISYYCSTISCAKCLLHNPGLCRNEGGSYTPWRDMSDERLQACLNAIGKQASPDNVNHPQHYELPEGLQVIDIEIATQGVEAVKQHCICTALEYLMRHKKKNGDEDVKKAAWWLAKYVELSEKEC